MGGGSWSDSDWSQTRSARATKSRDEVFTKRKADKAWDSRYVTLRESVDSADNPNSRPIILAMDVTGSMGFIPEYFAKEGLGILVEKLLSKKPVDDPHIMVAAVGDAKTDNYPLQVSQFEADNRTSEQLVQLYLEGYGGGNDTESYDLPWLFAATRTSCDSFRKRGKKGYIFTFGDEPAPNRVYSRKELEQQIGGKYEKDQYTSHEMLEMARKEWAVFHIIIEEGSRGMSRETHSTWRELLGPNAIRLNDYRHLADLVVAIIQVAEGADANHVLAESHAAVKYAFSQLEEV